MDFSLTLFAILFLKHPAWCKLCLIHVCKYKHTLFLGMLLVALILFYYFVLYQLAMQQPISNAALLNIPIILFAVIKNRKKLKYLQNFMIVCEV